MHQKKLSYPCFIWIFGLGLFLFLGVHNLLISQYSTKYYDERSYVLAQNTNTQWPVENGYIHNMEHITNNKNKIDHDKRGILLSRVHTKKRESLTSLLLLTSEEDPQSLKPLSRAPTLSTLAGAQSVDFAVVSGAFVLDNEYGGDQAYITEGAITLAKSVRYWGNAGNIDLIFLLYQPLSPHNEELLKRVGWRLRYTSPPPPFSLNQSEALLPSDHSMLAVYSVLQIWNLTEYSAGGVLFLQVDTLVIHNNTLNDIFQWHMKTLRLGTRSESSLLRLASVYDSGSLKKLIGNKIKTNVLLVIPDTQVYNQLTVHWTLLATFPLKYGPPFSDHFEHTQGKQAHEILQSLFQLVCRGVPYYSYDHDQSGCYVLLPQEYNVGISLKQDQKEWWDANLQNIKMIHYDVLKPSLSSSTLLYSLLNPFACWMRGFADLCKLWERIRTLQL